MTVEISTYIDVKKRVADLGFKQPDSLTILPRNFDAATSKDELLHEKQRADERTRTADLLITSELLYLLSYVGLCRAGSIS
jgi:hypothetical protein